MVKLNEKLKDLGGKVKDGIGKLNKKVRTIIIVCLALILVAVAAYVIVQQTRPYAVLFTDLNDEELKSVLGAMSGYGATKYKIEDNDTILVPASQENELRARLALDGYPKTGYSFDPYFERVSALSTESERNRAYLISLEEKLGATIRCMDGISEAVVTIAEGEDHAYVLDSSNVINASASVQVTMAGDNSLPDKYANAIRNLVSRAVQGLKVEDVVITDNHGNTYSASTGSSDIADASALKLQLEETQNNRIRTEILHVLVPMYGEDNVSVGVNTTVDVNTGIEETTNYFLPEWADDGSTNGEGIIGSKVYDDIVIRNPDDTAGGVVGTESNADLSTYVEEGLRPDGDEQQIEASGQIDYRTDTKKTYVERTSGRISDCTVSVSINSTTAGSINVAAIRSHVANAAGIVGITTEDMTADEYLASKVSIVAAPFFVQEQENDPNAPGTDRVIPPWVLYAAIAGAVLFVILLIIIIILSKKRKKRKQAELAAKLSEEEQQKMLEGFMAAAGLEGEPEGANVMDLQTEKSAELRKEIRKFVDSNPEIAAQIIRGMLNGGEGNA